MNRPLSPLLISVAVLTLAVRAPAGEAAKTLSIQLAHGRTITGRVIRQDESGLTVRYRGLSAVVTESVRLEEVDAITPVLPTGSTRTWTVDQVTNRFDAATLAEVARILLFQPDEA